MLDGEEFPIAGVNNYYLTFGSQSEVRRALDDAKLLGSNVVRTFISPVIGSLDMTTVPTIWDWKKREVSANLGVNGAYMLYWDPATKAPAFNDGADGLMKLDFLISEARKRDLKLIIAFMDFWKYTGGAHQVSAWYGSSDPTAFFGSDARARAAYKAWVGHILNRTNTIDGIAYKDDPVIMSWQLMNEPDIRPASSLRAWIEEMSAYVKSVDPHHLLSTGHWNLYDEFSDMEIKTIDYGTWHAYPLHWGVSVDEIDRRIPEFCALAKKANKPILLEEFGYARSQPDYLDAYRKWTSSVESNPDCAGWLVWSLVSRQDIGSFPADEVEQFDIRNNGHPVWDVLREAATRQRERRTRPSQ